MSDTDETTLDAWAFDGPRCDLCHAPLPFPEEANNRMCDDCLDNVRASDRSRWDDAHGLLEVDA